MEHLKDRVAIVTGCASGVGAAVAEKFLAEGAYVVGLDIAAAPAFLTGNPRATFRTHDVSKEDDWSATSRFISDAFGRLDILVNCAAYLKPGESIETTPLDSWRKTFLINTEGTFLACQHAVALMKHNKRGSIITVASGVAVRASVKAPAYGASKAAVLTLTKSVALHCANEGYNIRANVILPGALDTPMLRRNAEVAGLPVDDYLEKIRKTHPIGRIGLPRDIAETALFLASDASSFITGSELFVDGGQSI